jgi:DNA repair protein RadD
VFIAHKITLDPDTAQDAYTEAAAVRLRPYQTDIVAEFERVVAAGRRRIVLVAPTGSGKTIVGSSIISKAVAENKSVMVLAHRREIIKQTSEKLFSHGVRHGIIQAGFDDAPWENVQVAAVQTLWVRAMLRQTIALPAVDLLIVDEAHHCPAMTYRRIIEAYPNAIVLGLTATPCRGDGRGLGGIFEALIECPQVAELIRQGYLLPTRVYAPVDPDLRGVATRHGDYVEAQLAARMDNAALVGDIVTHWHKYGERRKTVCFAVSVGHSIHIRNEFLQSGVRAEHLDGSTSKPERDDILARLASGATELVTNCMVLTEGWDMPEVACCILARPTRKMGLYRQMIGRILRPADGKHNAIVLDHSGAVFRHGFVEDHVDWALDPDLQAASPRHAARQRGQSSGLLECSQCGAIRVAGEACGHCGFLPKRPAMPFVCDDGNLGLVDRTRRRAAANSNDPAERNRWHRELIFIAAQRGYKPGWVAHKYKERFGSFPPWGSPPPPLKAGGEVLSWVRSRMIAYARAQQKAAS